MIATRILTLAPITLALVAGGALAASDRLLDGKSRFGQPGTEGAGKVVDVASTKALNVQCGDTVTFVNGAKKFSWKFSTTTHAGVPVARIAPADFGPVAATVYVSRNDAERGG